VGKSKAGHKPVMEFHSLTRIVLIAPASVIHTVKWANGLSKRGFDVHLISQHEPRENVDSKVNIHMLPFTGGKGYFLNIIFLKKILKKLEPSIVNVHYATGYGTLMALTGIKGYILSVWGSDIYEFPHKSFLHKWLLKFNLNRANEIASTSKDMAREVRCVIDSDIKIEITPFGVNSSTFKSEKVPFSESEITIGVVKKLETKYGIDILLEGFAKTVSYYEKCDPLVAQKLRLLIVGTGSKELEFKKLAQFLNIHEKCHFVGEVPNNEVPIYINKIDVFVISSRIESFGVAAIEAGFCQRPCIVSNVGGLPEIIIDNQTGFIEPVESSLKFSQAMIKLIEQPQKAIEMGEAARLHCETHFSEERVLDKMVEVLCGKDRCK
jgi:glycosyltransferase involved in cell wall biosynthesis